MSDIFISGRPVSQVTGLGEFGLTKAQESQPVKKCRLCEEPVMHPKSQGCKYHNLKVAEMVKKERAMAKRAIRAARGAK